MPRVRGIVFDMDGTLVDSRLDYDAIRADLGLPRGVPILEAIAAIADVSTQQQMQDVMHSHEIKGADEAVLFEGVREFLNHVEDIGIFKAVLTRNSRASTQRTLTRLDLQFSQIVTREDAAPKPDPAGVVLIARQWGISPREMIVIGDYLFDLQAGRGAGARSVLFAPQDIPAFSGEADYILRHFHDAASLLERLHESPG